MASLGRDGRRARRVAARTAAAVALATVLALSAAGCGGGGGGSDGADGPEGMAEAAPSTAAAPAPTDSPATDSPPTDSPAEAGAAAAELGRSTVDVADLVGDYGLDPASCQVVAVPDAAAAVTCDLSPITYELVQLEDADAVAQRLDGHAEADGAELRPWRYADAPETVMGEMYTEAGGGRSMVRWTNEQRLVVGLAWQDGDDAATLAALEEWWSSDGSTPDPPPG